LTRYHCESEGWEHGMAGAEAIDGDYDYIIVGAGSAGCLLANRLSADGGKRVLILEAGGRDNWIWFHIPVGYLFAIGNPRSDWCFKTEPEAGLNGRSLNYPRGKAIGGSSAINAMIYMRGQAADYDHWRQLGLAGWGWDDVLPFFKQHENHFLGDDALYGTSGELRIEAPRVRWDLLDAFRTAAGQAGVKAVTDFNTGDNEGCSAFHVNQKRGRRWSSATAFLKPVLFRSNLRLETGCLVEAVSFDGRRARGVRWRQNGQTRTAQARGEVILAAGAIGSAHILQMSGVAAAWHRGDCRPAGRRRQFAGSSATAPDLQSRRYHHAERALPCAAGTCRHVARICAVSARPADHGAVAAWVVHPVRSRSRAGEFAIPHSTAVARPLR
jgi:choline dehydrogenase-like flavoprotein